MLRNKEESPDTSESSRTEHDLYNLHCNYTEQLNMVRRRFNLVEYQDDEYEGCKITEISDDSGMSPHDQSREHDSFSKCLPSSAPAKHKDSEVTTIHPFSLSYNLESGSSTNIFESDYSPPSKKVCQRLKTPRLATFSEASVSYHTKVGIHDSLFKASEEAQAQENIILNVGVKYFAKTRATQCNEEEFAEGNLVNEDEPGFKIWNVEEKISRLDLTYDANSECDSPASGTLFPKVIIDTKRREIDEESTISSPNAKIHTTSSSANKDSFRRLSKDNVLSLNSVRGSSDEEDEHQVSMTNTTIDTAGRKESKKNLIKKPKGKLEGLTMWEELTRLRSGTDDNNKVGYSGAGDSAKTGRINDFCMLNNYVDHLSQNIQLEECLNTEREKKPRVEGKMNQYVKQYIKYKTEVEKVRLASAKRQSKHTVIGQPVANIENMDSPEKLYQSENYLTDEERCTKSVTEDSSDSGTRTSFWERFCFCLCPKRNIDD